MGEYKPMCKYDFQVVGIQKEQQSLASIKKYLNHWGVQGYELKVLIPDMLIGPSQEVNDVLILEQCQFLDEPPMKKSDGS